MSQPNSAIIVCIHTVEPVLVPTYIENVPLWPKDDNQLRQALQTFVTLFHYFLQNLDMITRGSSKFRSKVCLVNVCTCTICVFHTVNYKNLLSTFLSSPISTKINYFTIIAK